MAVKYKTLITTAGAAKFAAATAGGTKVTLTHMAVGDGGGSLPVPDVGQTKLIGEQWRAPLNKISVDAKHKNYVVAELVIPPEVGGFWLREMGLYDADGTLVAIANMAESYKPELAEGSGRAQTVRMVIIISEIESVDLTIDTTTVMATQDYVDDKLAEHEQSRRHPDATLKEKGFTQLSSATNSDSETLAATPKAVKAAYDLANGKYSAQDATTARKGIVQLSNATNSASEVLAATPKAVSTAVKEIKDTLGTASGANTVISMTDTTLGRVPVVGWMGLGSVATRTAAVASDNYDNIPTGLPSGFWTHTISGGPYAYTFTLYQDGGAVRSSRHLIIPSNPAKKIAFRWDGATGTDSKDYQYFYTDKNKPTASDVGAVAKAGDTMTGPLAIKANGAALVMKTTMVNDSLYLLAQDANGSNLFYVGKGSKNNDDAVFNNYMGGNNNIILRSDGAVLIQAANGKNVSIAGQVIPSSYSNFDTRYYTKAQSDAGYMARTSAYTKAESDGRFQPKGSYTPAGQAYTKGESDGRFILADSVSTAGFASNDINRPYMRHKTTNTVVHLARTDYAYSKAESDGRYGVVNGIRRGGQQHKVGGDWIKAWEAPAGCIMTGLNTDEGNDGRKMGIYYRQLQYLNRQTGAWVNIGD